MNRYIELSSSEVMDETFCAKFAEDGEPMVKWVRNRMLELRDNATKTEIITAEYLFRRGVLFRTQMPFRIIKPDGTKAYFADFFLPELNLIIEIDGGSHNGREAYDEMRDEDFRFLGIKTLRISARQVSVGNFNSFFFIPEESRRTNGVEPKRKCLDDKAILYSCVLGERGLSVTEKIVYSQILYNAYLCGIAESDDSAWVKMPGSVDSGLYKVLNISRSQQYEAMKRLRIGGYINEANEVKIPPRLYRGGFFELQTKTGLRGLRLIVFSYICNKAKKYGWIDKYHSAMADDLGIKSEVQMQNILTDLFRGGYIQKKRKGRQVLLKTII